LDYNSDDVWFVIYMVETVYAFKASYYGKVNFMLTLIRDK